MAKKITQYPASAGNPDTQSLIDISEKIGASYVSKKLTIDQLLNYLTANLNINQYDTFLNETGSAFPIGIPCEIYQTAVTNIPSARPISASNSTTGLSQIYIASESVLNLNEGKFIKSGVVQMNTQSWVAGSKLFWDFGTSSLTNVATLEDQIFVGIVLKQDTYAGGGKIFASPTRSPQLIKGASGQIPLFMGERKINGNTRFTYIDNFGTEVGFRFSDSASNLTQVGVSYLNVETNTSADSVLRLANWSDTASRGVISFRKSRGSKTTPTQVLQDDEIGLILGTGQTNNGSGSTVFEMKIKALQDYFLDTSVNPIQRSALSELQILIAGQNDTNPTTPIPNNLVFRVNGNGQVYFKNYGFPILDGSANQILTTNGSGLLSWANASGGNNNTINNSVPFFDGSTNTLISSEFVYNPSLDCIGYNDGSVDMKLFGKYYKVEFYNGSTGNFISYDNGISLSMINEARYDGAKIQLSHRRGTEAVPQPLQIGDVIGSINFNPSKIIGQNACSIEAIATENQSLTLFDFGSKLVFKTTANGDFNPQPSLTIEQDGAIYFRNYALPANNGVTGQVLVADGLGMMQWQNLDGAFIPKMKGNEIFRGVTFQNNSTTITTLGGITNNLTGSQFANTVAITNYRTKQHTMRFEPSVVSTGVYCCMRNSALLWSIGGGFHFIGEFGISDSAYAVGTHNFWGLADTTSALAIGGVANNQPSVLTDFIAVANDSTDANLQIMFNDSIGVATKIDLGSSFPSNRTVGSSLTNMYLVEFRNEPSSTEVKYSVTNKETGVIATGTLTTNLPSTGTLLAYQGGRSMGTAGGGVTNSGRFDIARLGVYNI
jgi:hypothetical protein